MHDLAGGLPFTVDVDELLHGRARMLGLASRGRISASGSCRLVPATGGWVAVNLARPSDVESVPAVVAGEVDVDLADPWPAVATHATAHPAVDVAARYQLLGVPAAVLDDPAVDGAAAVVPHRLGSPSRLSSRPPVVLDLTSMWAGPLCAHLLGRGGMRVVKVESRHRPDGAHFGDPRFYRWLHDGHESLVLDFRDAAGRAELRRLVAEADVVLESSRPRALAQLGIDAEEVVASSPGTTWVSITGYGRSGDAAHRVAFGDDAAVAGGLVAHDDEGSPLFCGDAVADPLSGLAAAVAAFAAVADGGGQLVEVAMAGVARAIAHGR